MSSSVKNSLEGQTSRVDAVVIGGGPGGSTVATLLAKQGLKVALFERQKFPRFHIGESLLPASLPIFEELGVSEKIKKLFMKKPGGKWYYGNRPLMSDFSKGPEDTTFTKTPHAYMVTRADFDDVLLQNASENGAQIYQQHTVIDLIQEGEKVIGVVVKDASDQIHQFSCDKVFDCSGFGMVVAKKFNLRTNNRLKRMAVFGHYKVDMVNTDIKNGWFVGQMLYDGWIWMIPLKSDMISIGVVIPLERFQEAKLSPQDYLERHIKGMPIAQKAFATMPQLEGKVHLYGNLGYTTSRAYGDGWVLVGDAAFFIDPCYSSGVHLALSSGKEAAMLFLEQRKGLINQNVLYQKYEKSLRQDEKFVMRFVDSFYMASRNRVLKWLIPASTTERLNRSFIAMTGGDFSKRKFLVSWLFYLSKIISIILPFRAQNDFDIDLTKPIREPKDEKSKPNNNLLVELNK